MAGTGRRYSSNAIDFSIVVFSLIAGFIGNLISGGVYKFTKGIMWSPLAVGLSFMVFAIVFIAIMAFVNMKNDNLGYHLSKHHDGGKIFGALSIIVALSLILGILFEFLYEMNFYSEADMAQDPTSYVFIIDNSGSMSDSDPEGRRYTAIKEIIAQKDTNFPYAVYSFSDYVNVERELAPISAGNHKLEVNANGGTQIRHTLQDIYELYENGLKDDLGPRPKFLLLSDGYASDVGFFGRIEKVLKSYKKTPITISTVGLGQADDALMQKIADTTGGVYISVDDVSSIEASMQQAMTEDADMEARTLYTYRSVPKMDIAYALMRSIFTAILGILISCAMIFATGKGEDSQMIVITSLITGVLAGVVLEMGINVLGVPSALVKCLYFLLVASTFVTQKAFGGSGSAREYENKEDEFIVRRERLTMNKTAGIREKDNFGSFTGNNSSGNGNAGNSGTSGGFDDFFDSF